MKALTPEQHREFADAMDVVTLGKVVEYLESSVANCGCGVWLIEHRPASEWIPWTPHRIRKEPAMRPWSKPDDVPGPVCWIRGDGIVAVMIVGIPVGGDGVMTAFTTYSWFELERRKLEYSTDRIIWAKCQVPA